ncbi:MAG: small mechanosensitive ion channel, partial [Mesorhizobium sp.]
MPAIVADVMNAALQSSNTILREPPPVVAIKALDATAIEVDLFFRVANVGQRIPATNEIFDLVYRHSKSAGLRLATPPS